MIFAYKSSFRENFVDDEMDLIDILKLKKIAIVGISDKTDRPSYDVAKYLMSKGYQIFPVNPNLTEWNGIKTHKSLLEINEKIDIVNIFRKSEDVPLIVDEAIKMEAKVIWMQLGIVNEVAATKAKKAGLEVIMDKCIKIEHIKLQNR